MTTNATPSLRNTISLSSSRTFMSKLKAPFSSKNRNVIDFNIRVLDDLRRYGPGDLVKGTVTLSVIRPVRITHLIVCLHGSVRVLKNAAPGESIRTDCGPVGSGRGNRHAEYIGSGLASIFEKEKILCGEGRLEIGRYGFQFEMAFPSSSLPSSLDFEKGTISYMITSTLTRPTAISPTSSCDRKLRFVEAIDIGPLYPPKPRKISLTPITKQAKNTSSFKGTPVVSETSTANGSSQQVGDASVESSSTSGRSSADQSMVPHGSIISELSSDSVVASEASSAVRNPTTLTFSSSTARSRANTASLAAKTISAIIHPLRSGYLPGDTITVEVTVKHTKAIRSMRGVITTFYRQGRIDTHPVTPFPSSKGKSPEKSKHEEYYPKSRTGLGGLSLSSAGTSRVFRNEFSQTLTPLIVDPQTMTAVVRPSVRVPIEAFPTIATVPGAMISFRYYVEVVVDLGGKMSTQDRFFPRLAMINSPATYGASSGAAGLPSENGQQGGSITISGNILDTAQIRRERSVAACNFEVVIGTTDSSRRRGRPTEGFRFDADSAPRDISVHEIAPPSQRAAEGTRNIDQTPEYEYPQSHGHGIDPHDHFYANHPDAAIEQGPPVIPPPEIQNDEHLDEKTRLRQAEERLLPSSPPIEAESSTAAAHLLPSAPPSGHEDGSYEAYGNSPNWSAQTEAGPSSPSIDAIVQRPIPRGNTTSPRSEDKQELEHRRLQMEASAPDDFPDEDHIEGHRNPRLAASLGPSAPMLDESENIGHDEEHPTITNGQSLHESLPRYQR